MCVRSHLRNRRRCGAIVTLVERQTRFLVCRAVRRRTKTAVANAMTAMITPLKDAVNTITFDNGDDFADHAFIAKTLDCHVYFAKPYHAWECGTNENLNGDLRRIYPKGEPLDDIDRTDLAETTAAINARHCKILAYDTSAERFAHQRSVQLT